MAASSWPAIAARMVRRSLCSAAEKIARRQRMRTAPAIIVVVLLLAFTGVAHGAATHGMSLFGDLKYGPDFKHFDYVNPDAPKGGTMRYAAIGTFDNLNPFIIKGVPAAGVGNLFDTLMAEAQDEPASEYGLVAESADVAPDKRSVLFTLRKEARFHDGTPMTPVLSKAYWAGRDFEKTTLDPPLGSGPYKIEAVDPGRSITYRRVADYWAANLPVNQGRHNVDTIRYDYYRDATISLEAFKAGQYDVKLENSSKDWATGYDSPAVREGLIKKAEIPNQLPSGMQGFAYNLRRPLFQDPRVREALAYGFDFEWSNKNLFYDAYTRTRSYFDNSELAATEAPQGEELKILEKFRGQVPDRVFTTEYDPPKYDGSGNIRDGLRAALKLLKEAGWTFKGEKLVNDETGQPFEFEILLDNPQFERIALPFTKNLERMGITTRVRTVDTAQYEKRMETFDYDMAVVGFGQSLSPGNEQRDYWGSQAADEVGSRNLLGIKSKVIDELIEELVRARNRSSLVAHTRALDRVLQYGYYLIPHYHIAKFRVALWDKFRRPAISPKYAVGMDTWWIDRTAEQSVEAKKGEATKQ